MHGISLISTQVLFCSPQNESPPSAQAPLHMFTDADMPEETETRDELREDGIDMPEDIDITLEERELADDVTAISQRIHGRSSVSTQVMFVFAQNVSPPFAHAPAHALTDEAEEATDDEILDEEICDEERDEIREEEADEGSRQLIQGNPGVTTHTLPLAAQTAFPPFVQSVGRHSALHSPAIQNSPWLHSLSFEHNRGCGLGTDDRDEDWLLRDEAREEETLPVHCTQGNAPMAVHVWPFAAQNA